MGGTKIKQFHRLYTETLCPFLFQTRTIRSHNLPPKRTLHYLPRRKAVKPEGSSAAAEQTLNPLFHQPQPARQTDPSITSTITAEERRIFEKIKRRFGGTVEGITATISRSDDATLLREQHLHDLNLDNILSLYAPVPSSNAYEPVHHLQSEASKDEEAPHRPVSSSEIRAAALTSLQDVAKSIRSGLRSKTAPPDFALWRVLETEIFPLATLLQNRVLQQSSRSEETIIRYRYSQPTTIDDLRSLPDITDITDLPYMLRNADPRLPLLPFITILYPAATLLALRSYAAYLPTSGFAVALLPKIRALGPISYILAGNAHFFSCLIQLYWEIYSDLNTISSLMKDMHENGVDFNTSILAQLEQILHERDYALKTQTSNETEVEGSSSNTVNNGRTRAWWRMSFQRKPLEEIEKHWIPTIKQELAKREEETDEVDQ